MSNYSESESSCRVDFFKPSGKWYTTEAVEFSPDVYHMNPVDALRNSLPDRLAGMTAVCLHPYVENPYPVMIHNIG